MKNLMILGAATLVLFGWTTALPADDLAPLPAYDLAPLPIAEDPAACATSVGEETLTLPAEVSFAEVLTLAAKAEQEPQHLGACSATCPGSSRFGIPPYTIRCSPGQSCGGVVRDGQGRVCALICDGFGKLCFPDGC